MCDAIRHRGPDDWGTFVEGGVGLGMRRLSIIDLAGGHQPIGNEDGNLQVVFNGEIYNHEALRAGAGGARAPVPHRGPTPRSWSTSTRRTASGCSQRLRGMFAFAIWDRRRQPPVVARDHFGQKPLFYTERGRPADVRLRDQGAAGERSHARRAVARSRSTSISPSASSRRPTRSSSGIRALPPAHFLVWENGVTRTERYWDLSYGPKWTYSEAETLERIDELLAETVRAPPHERRAGRRVPERRPRLDADRLLRRQGAGARAPHLLDGHPVSRPERAAGGGGGGAAVRHPPLRGGSHAVGR